MLSTSSWIAHRGYPQHYPENSAVGISAALACGALWIEIDVQLTADHVPIIIHDAHTARVSSVNCNVLNTRWQQLSQLDNSEPKRFADTFKDCRFSALENLACLFTNYPTAQCMVEIKKESINAFGTDICFTQIKQALGAFIDRCLIISFDCYALAQIHPNHIPRIAPVLSNWRQRRQIMAQLPHAEMLLCNYRCINTDQIRCELPVAVYETTDFSQATALYARGATLIETFAIGEMLQQTLSQLPNVHTY